MDKPTLIIEHFSYSRETEKIIALLAKAEKRSKSAMIRILVEEALEARTHQDTHRT